MRDNIKKIKETYVKGMRVRLIKMNDIQAPPIGTEGLILGVDAVGSVLVEWDNGSNRIIKHTCKLLMNITSKKNQKEIRTILSRLNEVSDVQCKPNDCNNIRLSRMHRHYGVIISMSKMFLLNKMSNPELFMSI